MSYLSISNISKSYGAARVLNGISFILNAGERIGLVGANGVGKSTLLKIITGEIEPDSGAVIRTPGLQIGYLAQTIAAIGSQTIDDLIAESTGRLRGMETRMRELETQMAQKAGTALESALSEYGDLSDQFERAGGYDLEYRVDSVLDGLGVGHIPRDRVFNSLSGGEKARVGLAMLLLDAPDVLLLDEPTNHLDRVALTWLEDYLQRYRGAILIVSHDRQFLNRTASAIVEIDEHSRTAKRYSGDYDAYQRAKAEERRKWEADFAAQQEEIKALRIEMKETAHRNSNFRSASDGDKIALNKRRATHEDTVARRVRSAEEKLRRIEADPIPQPPTPLRFTADFAPELLQGRYPLRVAHVSKSFPTPNPSPSQWGGKGGVILRDVSFTLGLHSRVVLVGHNGAGKSTLLKIIAGVLVPDEGEIAYHPAVKIGYLAQDTASFGDTQTVFDAYAEGLPGAPQQLKATLLQSGLFRYSELEQPVNALSAGQQRKLQIARLIAGHANLLILDEPTNHVSFDVLESFESALRDFPGPIISASHDRRFIEQFGGEVWEISKISHA